MNVKHSIGCDYVSEQFGPWIRDLHGPQRAGPTVPPLCPQHSARPVDIISYFYRPRPGPARERLRSIKPDPARGPSLRPIYCIFTYLVMKHNTWSPWILRFKLTLILFALNPCIKSNIFPGICRMHEQFCRFYQLSNKCEARPGPARWMRKPGPAGHLHFVGLWARPAPALETCTGRRRPARPGPARCPQHPARHGDMISYFYRARPGLLKFKPGPARPVNVLDP